MGIFRRRKDRDETAGAAPFSDASHPADALDAFWAWWSDEGRGLAEASIAGSPNDALVATMGQRVDAIHPGLAWKLCAGARASHCLVVSPEGDPTLRATARRWAKSAPAPDRTWEFADTRRAAADPTAMQLQLGDANLSFADVVVGARREGHRVDVTVHHPSFPSLDERSRLTATFLSLDQALGETDVELWVGSVSPSVVPPLDGFGLAGLRAVVRDLKAEFIDDEGLPTWSILQGGDEDAPVLAMAQIHLSSAVAPELDTHVGVFVPYDDQTEGGLPGPRALLDLRALEDAVTSALGQKGRLVAHQSHDGVRLLHVYVDSTTDGAELVARAVNPWPHDVRVRVTPDPGWEHVAHLRS